MRNCDNCGNETKNPRFCSRSCAAKVTNKESVKRACTRVCVKAACNQTVAHYKTTLCLRHLESYEQSRLYKERTIGEYRQKLSVKGKHPSWLAVHVRNFNRSWNKEMTKLPCASCGYTKHVELCHLKPISLFTDDTPLGIVNSSSNVVQLCRNCHWEFDNGLLRLS